jgi:hypothetical protein
MPFPGLKAFATLTGANRGIHVWKGELYTVNGQSLYKVEADGSSVNLGTIEGASRVDMASSGAYLVIVTGDKAYSTLGGAPTVIADTDLVKPTTVAYLNSQFIFDLNDGNPGEFIVSDVGDPTSINALNFATAESHPDDIQKIIAYDQNILFFGDKSIEPWYNSGTGSPPFDRINGAVRPFGVAGKWVIGQTKDNVYFLSNDRVPYRLFGLEVTPIGNPAIGQEWDTYSRVDDAVGFALILNQQEFYFLNFPTADKTWVYHAESNSWFQLSFGVNGGRSRGISHACVYGKNIVADHSNGKLYELDVETFTDNGEVIQRKRATAAVHSGLYRESGLPSGFSLTYNSVEFVMQTGEGITTGQGSTPQLMVRISDDGGGTWSAGVWVPLGAGGAYETRAVLYGLGTAYQRLFELTFTDPVDFSLISAHADVEIGI